MSVLSDIRTKILELLAGTAAGGIRMPAVGRFLVVGSDVDVQQADPMNPSPRPCYLMAGGEVPDPTIPSDVAGDYHWEARALPLVVAYAYSPEDTPIERDSLMDDDELSIKRVLMEPLNLALVAGWGKCRVEATRSEIRDAQMVDAVKLLSCTVTITYREDWI